LKVYLDTSVLLAWFLEKGDHLERIPKLAVVASSRLLWIETARVLERAVSQGQLTTENFVSIKRSFSVMSEGISTLRLNDEVLKRAEGSFPLTVRTLDALHLSTALVWLGGDDPYGMEFWTLDRQLNHCAAAMGMNTPLL
jgi:predicted nucleic acid-binding protein